MLAVALALWRQVNEAAESAPAHLVQLQTLRWVWQLVGFPGAGGRLASWGMVSNRTAVMVARTQVFPDRPRTGVGTARAGREREREAHSS